MYIIKNKFACLIISVFFLTVLTFTGCDDKDSSDTNPNNPSGYAESKLPVYFSPSLKPSILLTALKQTFVNQVGLDDAKIAFVGPSVQSSEIDSYYSNGGFVMICSVDNNTENILSAKNLGMPSIPEYKNDSENGQIENMMLYGFNSDGDEYWMPWPFMHPEPDLTNIKETKDTGSESPDPDDPDDPDRTVESAPLSIPEYDSDYLCSQFGSLVEWAGNNDTFNDNDVKATKAEKNDGDMLSLESFAKRHHFVYPISIFGFIDKATWSDPDFLWKQGTIVGDVEITPLYASSATPESDAGDYYIVRLDLTVKSGTMWGPEQHSHGGINNRIIGYYLKQMDLNATLTDAYGRQLYDVMFKTDGAPYPETNQGSSDHTESRTLGFSIGVTGGYGQTQGWDVHPSASFNASWTKSVTRSLKDVQVKLDTPDNAVKYCLSINNIQNGRDWDNVGKDITAHYPEVCRSDMRYSCYWVWYLPRQQYSGMGVDDGSDSYFKMNLKLCPTYGTYNWWRGASWDEEKEFVPNMPTVVRADNKSMIGAGPCFLDIDMPAPNRTKFGQIELTNMSSLYTLTDVKIKKIGSSDYYQIQGAVNKDKSITIPLNEGTYDVEFTFVDANTNEKNGSYRIPSVKVTQGRTKEESTTKIASTQGEKM